MIFQGEGDEYDGKSKDPEAKDYESIDEALSDDDDSSDDSSEEMEETKIKVEKSPPREAPKPAEEKEASKLMPPPTDLPRKKSIEESKVMVKKEPEIDPKTLKRPLAAMLPEKYRGKKVFFFKKKSQKRIRLRQKIFLDPSSMI